MPAVPTTKLAPPIRLQRPRAAGLTALLLASGFVAVPAVSQGPPSGPASQFDWPVGRPVPIAAVAGQVRFSIPTPGPSSRTLLVVSTLARDAGPFPVRVASTAVGPVGMPPPTIEPPRAPRQVTPPVVNLPAVKGLPSGAPAATRVFHLMVLDGDVSSASNYRAVRGVLRATGTRVQVYVDEADEVAPGVVDDVVNTFDANVFPVAARTFGQAADVDHDGRFTVFVSGWLTRLAGGRHVVDGFVRGADFAAGLPAPFSNHCDMMYLSAALQPGPHLRTVVAHEYTHAVSFCARTLPPAGTRPAVLEEEGWLDEAAAHLVEDLHGFSRTNLDYRVSAFLSRPEQYRMIVDDYYAADLFRGHGNRGATYLFLRWCVDRFGPGLLPALIASDRRGVGNIEGATGWSFPDLYRAWSLALFTSGFDPSRGPRDDFRTIGLRGPFDGWDLAGPRTTSLEANATPLQWTSAGTASRYLVVEPAPTGAVSIEVSASANAGLQITALRLPDDLARLDLTVDRVSGPGGAPSIRFSVRESNGTPVTLDSVAWEPLVPAADPHAPGFRHAGLKSSAIASAFGETDLRPGGRLVSHAIPASDALGLGVPLVVKVVGTDARGRRVTAWSDVTVPPSEELARSPVAIVPGPTLAR